MRCPLAARLACSTGLALLAGVATLALAPAAQAATAPRTVQVVTVPAYPNVTFSLNGITYQTGPDGSQTVPDSNLKNAATDLQLTPQTLPNNVRVSLDRVANNPNHGSFARLLVAELDVDRPVTIKLLKPQGTPLAPDQVTSVTLNDSLGGTTVLNQSALKGPVWLAASRPARVAAGVTGRTVTYSIKSVIDGGTNVVNSGQLRYTANRTLVWTVPVILHSLTIQGNDLLAGAPAGTSVQLTYPDQQKVTVVLGPDHRVTLVDLPRGDYKLKVNGGLLPLASTVRLSRDQTATELVVTAGDAAEMGAVVVTVLAIIVAAGIIGRRLRLRAAIDQPADKKLRGAHRARSAHSA